MVERRGRRKTFIKRGNIVCEHYKIISEERWPIWGTLGKQRGKKKRKDELEVTTIRDSERSLTLRQPPLKRQEDQKYLPRGDK